jgi:hypothetical protein
LYIYYTFHDHLELLTSTGLACGTPAAKQEGGLTKPDVELSSEPSWEATRRVQSLQGSADTTKAYIQGVCLIRYLPYEHINSWTPFRARPVTALPPGSCGRGLTEPSVVPNAQRERDLGEPKAVVPSVAATQRALRRLTGSWCRSARPSPAAAAWPPRTSPSPSAS